MASSIAPSTMADQAPDEQTEGPLQDLIHDRLEYYFNSLSLPWKSPMNFPMHVGFLCAQETETKDVDICSFISGDYAEASYSPFAYFDRTQYPHEDSPKVSQKLHTALVQAASLAGFQLTSNGRSYKKEVLSGRQKYPMNSTPPVGSVTYVCSRYDAHSKIVKDGQQQTSHRGVSLHNNARGNSRGLDGKKGPRKSNSTKADSSLNACRFRLNIFWDANGYYLQKGSGCVTHCKHMRRHPKDIPISIRQYPVELKNTLGELSKGMITAAAGRNYLHSVHGITATLPQVRYALRVFDADNERHYFGEQAGPTGLLGWLEEHKNDTSYCVWQANREDADLSAVERNSNLIFNEDTIEGITTVTDLSEMCREVLREYQNEVELLKLRKDQNLFIACSWMTNKERRIFRLFPHVVKVDVVKGTNQEDRPLLTGSVRTSQGKYIVVFRMLLSHERKISFRWVFSHALPTMVGQEHMAQVKVIMTDGDSNEMEELDLAIDKYMPRCRRIRCGWHIVYKGFKRKLPLEHAVDRRKKGLFLRFAKAIRNWCYTFMRPGYCETPYELTASKCIMLAYLHSRHVRRFLDAPKRLMVQNFLVSGVFVHDKYFCHVHRRNLRSYEECTNSSHEGTNNGVKSHSCPTARNGTIATTAMNLRLQSDIGIDQEFRQLNSKVEGRPVWNEKNAGDQSALVELTPFAHDLVFDQWTRRLTFNVCRSPGEENKWYVRKKEEDVQHPTKVLNPIWRRTWEVTLDLPSKRLLCSCCYFERRGMPCRHQAAVIGHEDPGSIGFTYRDCSVVWWKRYMFFHQRATNQMTDYLRYLFENDIVGPSAPARYFVDRLFHPDTGPHFPFGEDSSICINYPTDALELAISRFSTIVVESGETRQEVRHHDVGLSQESYGAPEYEDEEEMDGVYEFRHRNPPPDDPDIPSEEPFAADEGSSDDDSEEEDTFVPLDTEQDADLVMHQDAQMVQEILERDEVIQFPGFIKQVRDKIQEQLDLLESYSRSGHCNVNRYDLRQISDECIKPLLEFRLKVYSDIAEHSGQNTGRTHVSANCVNPTKKRRVRGANWGLSQFQG